MPAKPEPLLLEVLSRVMTEARQKAGLSRADLAKSAGVTVAYVGLIERQLAQPTLSTFVRLADSLGRDRGELFEEVFARLKRERSLRCSSSSP